jgi:hypothetical protein
MVTPFAAIPADDADRKAWYADIARNEEIALAQMRVLGIDVNIEQKFYCVLHEEKAASANLHVAGNGEIVYADWHGEGIERYLLLPELRASLAYGQVKKLKPPELTRWRLVLLYEAGLLEPVDVPLPPMPPGASEDVRSAYRGLRLLFGLRRTAGDESPTPFTPRFAIAWSGISSYKRARNAIAALEDAGVIVVEGTASSFGRDYPLFVPGEDDVASELLENVSEFR